MQNEQAQSRIEQINTKLDESLPKVKELRQRAIDLKKAGDVKGRNLVNQQLSVLLSEREQLKSERLSLLANSRASSDSSPESKQA